MTPTKEGGSQENENTDTDAGRGAAEEAQASSQEKTQQSAPSILVAYYSAQGHTKVVAETAAAALGADLFEITPKDPYTENDLDYNDDSSRVCREYENEQERDVELVQTAPEGFDGYDTVLVGYPIWWGIAAWPVNRFVSENDFSGKTVIPFCTSASSGLGQSGSNLEELAGTGKWQEGMRFASSVDETEVEQWAKGLAG